MSVNEPGNSSKWSRDQDKAFENAIATYPEDCSDWWEKIAAAVPGKTLEEIKEHYEILVEDVNRIESGCVPLPPYDSDGPAGHDSGEGTGKKGTSKCRAE
ncbi:Transcription factor RADIALIS [Hibiscus syriacus]|uniref:Transcription factor RADIALIS n=1 Tax=Hibiscus syriacus TaxID=106335 RepID=A0A6A2ZIG3_HIBSY|nr:Transcription factor RADIALIS [Hibiscus syriacus]